MRSLSMLVEGNIVDVFKGEIFPGVVVVKDGYIVDIERGVDGGGEYIIPGFVDAHVHIESSMLPPYEFSRLDLLHGTVAAICDPHEIANVLGVDGVRYMVRESRTSPMKMVFSAPSCVPATEFETNGATVGVNDVEEILNMDGVVCLGEVMDFPGVIRGERDVMEKIAVAKRLGKPVDGHAPGLMGERLFVYAGAGISTDHESISLEEAREKIEFGVKILIREGSAAGILDRLYPLIDEFPDMVMFCTDDKHPDDLLEGCIDKMVKRAVELGCDVFNVLKAASVNPVLHYGIDVGLLRVGDRADFLKVNNLREFRVVDVYIDGECIVSNGDLALPYKRAKVVNRFVERDVDVSEIQVRHRGGGLRVMGVRDKTLVTTSMVVDPRVEKGMVISDVAEDVLKVVVVNRYGNTPPAIGFVHGFGLQRGAIASSVAHDSHNVVAVGCDDRSIVEVLKLIFGEKGGIAAFWDGNREVLPLPVAGLMSDGECFAVAEKYSCISDFVKSVLGSCMVSPFMTLSFLCLPVIPELKITDKGLFDVLSFKFVSLFV